MTRKEEILEELSRLSEWELKSYCLNQVDAEIIKIVLDYKNSKDITK